MVRIFGVIETLKKLQQDLNIDCLDDFFQLFDELVSKKEKLIIQGRVESKVELFQLQSEIEKSENELKEYSKDKDKRFIKRIYNIISIYNQWRKIWKLKYKIADIEADLSWYAIKKMQNQISDIDYQIRKIENYKSLYYWALWESAVVNKISHIYWNGILINNFVQRFDTPIFSKGWKDKIMSIQIDHIFINEKWIFLIETKNWSHKSQNTYEYTPIQQIKRSGYAFYQFLKIYLNMSDKEIPTVFKIVVFTWKEKMYSNEKYINTLLLNELPSFINTRTSKMSIERYNKIWDLLIQCNQSEIYS